MHIFQYGSNLSSQRLNGPERLQGRARVVGIARTRTNFQFSFPVWGGINGCAAAGILPGGAHSAWGVIYDIPEPWVIRSQGQAITLDAIEDEGSDYRRQTIELCWADGGPVQNRVETYLPLAPRQDLSTEFHYVRHILLGAREHGLPSSYQEILAHSAIRNNSELADPIHAFLNEGKTP